MIIDAHTHIDKAGGKNWTPEQLIASMDEAGIDCSIVISNHITEAPLDDLLKKVRDFDRLKIVGNIEFEHWSEAQLIKLTDLLKKKEIIGIKLFPGYENYFPYDEKLYPLFEYCQANGHPVMIHAGGLLTGCKGYLEQAHPLHVDRLANDFPKLKIIIAHMGNPWLIDTIAVMWKNKNVYTDFSGFFAEFKTIHPLEVEYFLQRMKEVRGLISFRRFIFGTDWPLYSQKEYLQTVQYIPFSEEEKELVFWKNANYVFNLNIK